MNTIGYRPTNPRELTRAGDRVSFLYLERAVINRDSNAITATDERGTVHIPAASVGVLLLGPGTTITHQAITLMSDSGSTVVWVGERGVRYYAHGSSLARSSRLLEAQAAAVTSRKARLRVAREMYAMRFPGEDVSGMAMQQLRGREGSRVRRVYRENAERTGLEWSRRNYDPENWDDGDPVNQALSAANSALYGAVHAVIVALGCSPALGFIHTGHHRSFVYDVADLYKADLTIPIAFDVAAEEEGEIGPVTRRQVRDALHDGRLLERCARDIRRLLLPEEDPESDAQDDADMDFDNVSLWDEYVVSVRGGISYGDAS
ncbi:type I-E CRISPR-associated endonuclease Cas1e [Phytoactinopolyspora mesophila]|uniref:CRISPR-associated endonuclease Cas1 n=1 Tax=Phytoactinopolyspora mesophila TaxID=2650750 RepID=A0A7K3LZY0_9ACTN|nr:type I-E CRISPR-associated endonuclease Cas1e [Phytoactinopolyspora mesophila]NDL56605.1 type I-E CRISPR-associated endonuclease Cas1 [Phytoactinopolyspora mesophila]